MKWSIKTPTLLNTECIHIKYTHFHRTHYHSGKVSNLLLLTSRCLLLFVSFWWRKKTLQWFPILCYTRYNNSIFFSFLSNNEICLLYNKHKIFTLPCNFTCWELFRRNQQHSCVANILENIQAHAQCTHPLESRKTNDNLRDDLIKICQNFGYCVEVKLYEIQLFFYFLHEYHKNQLLWPLASVLVLVLVRFGLISCQEAYYFQFAYFFVFIVIFILYNIFSFDFSMHRIPSKLQQQHPTTYTTNHVPFGAWYWIKWLLNSSKQTCIA